MRTISLPVAQVCREGHSKGERKSLANCPRLDNEKEQTHVRYVSSIPYSTQLETTVWSRAPGLNDHAAYDTQLSVYTYIQFIYIYITHIFQHATVKYMGHC